MKYLSFNFRKSQLGPTPKSLAKDARVDFLAISGPLYFGALLIRPYLTYYKGKASADESQSNQMAFGAANRVPLLTTFGRQSNRPRDVHAHFSRKAGTVRVDASAWSRMCSRETAETERKLNLGTCDDERDGALRRSERFCE